MGERAEIAVMVGVTGLAAYVGYHTPGLAGAEISAVVPAFVGSLFAQRKDNLVTVTEDATKLAHMDGADLVAWIEADDRHAAFLSDALEAAWSTLDRHNLRALSHVLADGFQDDARLDVDRLVIKALREFEAPRVRVLELMASVGGIDKAYVLTTLPELSDGLDSILAVLERTGCLARSDGKGSVRRGRATTGYAIWACLPRRVAESPIRIGRIRRARLAARADDKVLSRLCAASPPVGPPPATLRADRLQVHVHLADIVGEPARGNKRPPNTLSQRKVVTSGGNHASTSAHWTDERRCVDTNQCGRRIGRGVSLDGRHPYTGR